MQVTMSAAESNLARLGKLVWEGGISHSQRGETLFASWFPTQMESPKRRICHGLTV